MKTGDNLKFVVNKNDLLNFLIWLVVVFFFIKWIIDGAKELVMIILISYFFR